MWYNEKIGNMELITGDLAQASRDFASAVYVREYTFIIISNPNDDIPEIAIQFKGDARAMLLRLANFLLLAHLAGKTRMVFGLKGSTNETFVSEATKILGEKPTLVAMDGPPAPA